jgi:hypothetical protein
VHPWCRYCADRIRPFSYVLTGAANVNGALLMHLVSASDLVLTS